MTSRVERTGAPAPSAPSGHSGVPSSLRSDRPSAALRVPGAARGCALALLGLLAAPAVAAPPRGAPAWRELPGPWTGAARMSVGSVDRATLCASAGMPVLVWADAEGVRVRVGVDGADVLVGPSKAASPSLRVGALGERLLVTWTGPDGRTPWAHAVCTLADGAPRWTFVEGAEAPPDTPAQTAVPLGEEESLEVVALDGAEALVHHTPRGTHEVRRSRAMLLGRSATGPSARWVPVYEGGAARLLALGLPWGAPTPRWRDVEGPWRGAHTLAVVASGLPGCAPAGAPVVAWSTPEGTRARVGEVQVSLAGPGSVGLGLAAHGGIVFASWVEGERSRVAACEDGRWASVGEHEAVAGTRGDPARERTVDGVRLRVDASPDGANALTHLEGAAPMTVWTTPHALRLGEPAVVGRDLWVPVYEDGRARLFVQEAP